VSDILDTLEFNGLHSGHDILTRTLFLMAAEKIRNVQHERDHWRRMLRVEEAGMRIARADARRLEDKLSALIRAHDELVQASAPLPDAVEEAGR
jgi:hypothetical protein